MARPLPDDAEATRRGSEVKAIVDALGGYQAAVAALAGAGQTIRWESLRRYVRAERVAPDDLLETLRALAADRPRWVKGRDEGGGRWIVHLHRPRFAARVVDGAVTQIDWIDERPAARRHGMLVAEATAQICGIRQQTHHAQAGPVITESCDYSITYPGSFR